MPVLIGAVKQLASHAKAFGLYQAHLFLFDTAPTSFIFNPGDKVVAPLRVEVFTSSAYKTHCVFTVPQERDGDDEDVSGGAVTVYVRIHRMAA